MKLLNYTPVEFLSLRHILILLICIAFVLTVFFLRGFFIKHRLADKIFRYTLVAIMIISEAIYYVKFDKLSLTFAKMLPLALCTYSEIITIIFLLSDSKRLCKVILPFATCGALLSLFFVQTEQCYTAFRTFHYFGNHLLFMLGNLYFLFTKRINIYTYKDFSVSCLVLLCISAIMIILVGLGVTDEFFLLTPPGGLEHTIDVLGQIGYSVLYPILVCLIMASVSFISYICTRHRDVNEEVNPQFKENKLLNKLSSIDKFKRIYAFLVTICVFSFITTIQAKTHNIVLYVLCCILLFAIFVMAILNEVINNYNLYTKANKNTDE